MLHLFDSRSINGYEENGITVISKTLVVFEIPGLTRTKFNRFDLWLGQRAFNRLYRYYRKIKGDADLIHAHIIHNAYHCKKVLDKYHLPLIITEHWSKMNATVLGNNLLRLGVGYRWADKVICVSDELSDSLMKKFGKKCVVINNMVSDVFFEGDNTSTKFPHVDMVHFVSVGTIEKRKGFDLTIKALAKAKCRNRCRLEIVGSGPEEDNLRKLIEQYGLNEHVFLVGRKKPEDVNQLIAASDCFILTSRLETFGIVYIEAMAKGKPVIATVCGGPEGFVNDSNGILIPSEDVDAASKAIDSMVENINRYDNASIRQYCHDNFSEEAISQKIISVYKEVLEQHKK